jgi:hypothetical protein
MAAQINAKSIDGQFLRELENDFGLTPVVAHALLKRSQEMVGGASFLSNQAKVGQFRVLAVSADEPAGKPLSQCRMVDINLTLDSGKEDDENLRENGAVASRQAVFCRIADEAVEQGAYLTEEDAARILRCDVRTIKRDVRYFRKLGIFVPLRGQMVNTGRGQTHKVAIIRWFVQGMTFSDIQMKVRHSINAISRYIDMFGRVVALDRRGITTPAIAQIVSISLPLAEQYVRLSKELDLPEYQDQLNRIANRIRLPERITALKKRRVR